MPPPFICPNCRNVTSTCTSCGGIVARSRQPRLPPLPDTPLDKAATLLKSIHQKVRSAKTVEEQRQLVHNWLQENLGQGDIFFTGTIADREALISETLKNLR